MDTETSAMEPKGVMQQISEHWRVGEEGHLLFGVASDAVRC